MIGAEGVIPLLKCRNIPKWIWLRRVTLAASEEQAFDRMPGRAQGSGAPGKMNSLLVFRTNEGDG
jgi:hypothetical protein